MERASLKKMASKVDAQEYPTKDELFEGSEDKVWIPGKKMEQFFKENETINGLKIPTS